MADVAETIEESGRRIGHHAWVEARLFEVVGSSVDLDNVDGRGARG